MRARSFLALSALTLLVTAAAGVAVVRQDRPQSTIAAGGPVLPGLADRLGEVTSIVVRSTDGVATLRRTGNGWVLAESNDYPVLADRVRELVRAIVALEKMEPKTASAERYARLGVEDVGAEGARSRDVILQNAAGDAVAHLIVGKPGSGAGAEGATYVRVAGDSQSWLAKGQIEASIAPRDWLDRRLIAIPAADIGEVRVVRPDGSTLTVVRDGSGAGTFRLADLPKGATLKRPDAADSLVQTFAELSFDDVRQREASPAPAAGATRVTVTRTDGATVAFDVIEQDGVRWLRFVPGSAPAALPEVAKDMVFQVPSWKIAPLERPRAELIDSGSGS